MPKRPGCVECGMATDQRCLYCRKPIHRRDGQLVSECFERHVLKCQQAKEIQYNHVETALNQVAM